MARLTADSGRSGRTILLVDDNPEYLQATKLVLSREGHDILTASNGPEALDVLRREAVELVLLDYFMPGMTGAEVVEELRTFDKQVQVILQTGYASEGSPGELVSKLDIQGYFDKSEGADKLLLWTEVGLKSARTVQTLSAQLLVDAEKRAVRMSILHEISQALSRNLELDSLLETVYREVSRVFGTNNFGLATYEEGSDKWHSTMFMINGTRYPEKYHGLGEGLTGHVISTRKPLLLRSWKEISGFHQAQGQSRLGEPCNSWMGVPLIAGNSIEGSLCIYGCQEEDLYDESDLAMLSMIGTQVAMAIKNAQLYRQAAEARAEAEEANRTKSRFLANTSHELRTPLNAIINFSWLLGQESSSLDPDQLDLLKRIGESGHYLLDLINDLLDLAKIESGRVDVFPEDMDLEGLIVDVFKTIEGMVAGKDVELMMELPGHLPAIHADRAKLRQIMLNLLSNASKFTDKGHIKVAAKPSGAFLVIRVEDSGIGMDPADISKLFNEYTQLESGIRRNVTGTGLGLAISRRFVELMGGTMWVESRIGEGSVFSFTMPLSGAFQA